MLPPDNQGFITFIANADYYTIQDTILQLEYQSCTLSFTMLQTWPLRKLRPIGEKIVSKIPVLSGIRIIDTLFPIAQGATCGIAGGSSSGKTDLCQNIAQYSNSDIVVFVACGERGNEIAQLKNNSFVNKKKYKFFMSFKNNLKEHVLLRK